jgi:hypothetical protein
VLDDVVQRGAWGDNTGTDAALAALTAALCQNSLQHMLFQGLLQHVASPSMRADHQVAAIQLTARVADDLAPAYLLPSLGAALQLLVRPILHYMHCRNQSN